MRMKTIDYWQLLKLVYDVKRLRSNVSRMSFITHSTSLVHLPEAIHDREE